MELGTVSHGTLRNEDLIPAFVSALDGLREEATFADGADSPMAVARYAREDDVLGAIEDRLDTDGYYDSEVAGWDLDDLFDLLNDRCPEGVYFGAIDGDGSDFGFWRAEDDLAPEPLDSTWSSTAAKPHNPAGC